MYRILVLSQRQYRRITILDLDDQIGPGSSYSTLDMNIKCAGAHCSPAVSEPEPFFLGHLRIAFQLCLTMDPASSSFETCEYSIKIVVYSTHSLCLNLVKLLI